MVLGKGIDFVFHGLGVRWQYVATDKVESGLTAATPVVCGTVHSDPCRFNGSDPIMLQSLTKSPPILPTTPRGTGRIPLTHHLSRRHRLRSRSDGATLAILILPQFPLPIPLVRDPAVRN